MYIYVCVLAFPLTLTLPLNSFATLVVTKQPFPKPIKKNTKVSSATEEPTLVRMLVGAKADVRAVSKVRAELIYEVGSVREIEHSPQNFSGVKRT
jgi:STATa Immunoglobulin-like domain